VQVTVTACPTPPPAPEPELGVVAAPDCVAEGAVGGTVTVPVSADGATGLSVKLTGGDSVDETEAVVDGSVVFDDVPVGSYTVTLLKGGEAVAGQSAQVTVTACPTPPPAPNPNPITNAAAAVDICVDEGVQVDLSNKGSGVNRAVTFLVSVNGVTRSVEVPAQGEKAEVFPAEEDAAVTVVVTAGDKVIHQLTDLRDCVEVQPGEEEEPPAEEPAPEPPAEEPPAGEEQPQQEQPAEEEEEQPQEQPETAVLGTKLPAVQPNTSAQTGQLPRTGTDPTGLLALALGLLAAGAAGMIGSSLIGRRRRA
ncbi:hypothetical protein ACFP6A_05095, partial [Quadrisphaera sp. GCM10027208]